MKSTESAIYTLSQAELLQAYTEDVFEYVGYPEVQRSIAEERLAHDQAFITLPAEVVALQQIDGDR